MLKKLVDKSYIDKIAFIEIKDRKVLVTLSKGKDKWYIPGGKREEKETDTEVLTREVKEELMVDIDPTTIKLYGVFKAQAHGKPQGTMIRMICYTASYEGQLTPNAEIEKMSYFPHSNKQLCSLVDNLIFDDLKN